MTKDWIETSLRINEKIGDFMMWFGVRTALLIPAVGIYAWKQGSKLSLHLAEMAEKSYSKVLIVFDSLPYGGMAGTKLIEVEAKTISQSFEIITDLLAAVEEKELMILGEKGTGKSTLAQYLAYNLGGQIRVYEPEGTPEDWSGLEVLGKGENWEEINKAMNADLLHISEQMQLRREKGESALAGTDRCIIAEEYPEIAAKCDVSDEWLDRHARRGRKARIRLILLSQYDAMSAWNLEGRSDLLDCFFRLRLGKKALKHAAKLKRDDLVQWLKSNRSHALLDDDPVILPDYREMRRVIEQMGMVTPQLSAAYEPTTRSTPELPPEASENQGFQPPEAGFSESPKTLLEQILAAFRDGKSDDWIAKNVYQCPGGNSYYKAKEAIAFIRGKVQ
jgi:energy-coupling factor transporter ATP-binding protein EcfA2